MKKLLLLIVAMCLLVSVPVEAKQKRRYKIIYKTVEVEEEQLEYMGRFYITHYCPCLRCCGKWGGRVTASGTTPTAGRTVGVNPRLLPYGTKLKVGNTGGYVAEDTGGGIGWKHLDIFCNSHSEALSKGVGYEPVYKVTYKTVKKRVKVRVPILKSKISDWRVKK